MIFTTDKIKGPSSFRICDEQAIHVAYLCKRSPSRYDREIVSSLDSLPQEGMSPEGIPEDELKPQPSNASARDISLRRGGTGRTSGRASPEAESRKCVPSHHESVRLIDHSATDST